MSALADRPELYRWWPATPAQEAALDSEAGILFFGGSAGSLKTETMLMDAVQERRNQNMRAIVFRKEYTQFPDIIDKTRKLYTPLGGDYVDSPKWTWTFPSGAKVRFGYITQDQDVFKYLGPRYSFIGFDESTLHTEFQVRNILGRLSSTDRALRLRMRLASNPGNIGAGWHKHTFLKGHCPVHSPGRSTIPGKLYTDATWQSDNYPIEESVAFIPGSLKDHQLLDEKYVLRLRGMSGAWSKAMELGCWCALEGAYFGNWDKNRMVVPYPTLNENWWDSHFISMDYGFGKSSAAAYLHVKLQNGKLATIGELVAAELPAYEFANEVVRRFVEPTYQGSRRRIVAVYADPANFSPAYDIRIGTAGHAVSDQINEVLEPYGLGVMKAASDRIGGWQLMYQMLSKGDWVIAETCPKLVDAIPTRMHDEKRPGDLVKVPGDPLDDASDCARYGIYSFITASDKPRDLVAREAVKPLAEIGDLTGAAIRFNQLKEQDAGSSHPAVLGRRGPQSYRSRRF